MFIITTILITHISNKHLEKSITIVANYVSFQNNVNSCRKGNGISKSDINTNGINNSIGTKLLSKDNVDDDSEKLRGNDCYNDNDSDNNIMIVSLLW